MKQKSVIKKSAMIPTALIAGGAGFVGSHLAEALLEKGARVIILDNFQTGKQSYVNHLISSPNFALYDCDINEGLPADIQSVDYVFHLAGLEEYSYAKEVLDLGSLMTNAFGTKHLLDLAKNSDAKFLLVSTIDVYDGHMSQLELSEYFGKSKIEESRYMLAEAKRYAEALVWEYFKKNNTDVRIVRVPEIYGPRMNLLSSGNLGKFLSDLIAGRDITIYGEGVEKEYYLYVTDVVSGLLKSMYGDRTKGNIYSLVPDDPVSVLELAYMVKGVADAGIQVRFVENAQTASAQKALASKQPDTYNLKDLRWEAKVALREGLMKSLAFFNYSANPYSFKPAKLIEQKAQSDAATIVDATTNNLFSLQDVKSPEIVKAPKQGANFVQKPKREFPKIHFSLRLPAFNVHLPKPKLPIPRIFANVNLPKLPQIPTSIASKIGLFFAVLIPIVAIFIAFPAISVYVNAKNAFEQIKTAANSGTKLDSTQLQTSSKLAYENFYRTRGYLSNLQPVFSITGQTKYFKSYDNLISSLTYFSKAMYSGAKAAKPLESLWEVIRPDTSNEIDAFAFEDAKNQLDLAKSNLLRAQADLKYVDSALLPEKFKPYFDKYAAVLSQASAGIDAGIPLYSSLPRILGSDATKKYLILFQNSNELRPTGGFIGSYGVLTVSKGKIKDLVIDDVYNPDGQIDQRNIVSDLPSPIAQFLKEDKLHIRNANWDPNFTNTANTIEDLYFKVTGEKVDGVIAVDLYFIQNLLRATGPIFLTAYNEEVSAENVYERAEFHSEFNYADGSDQKRSFLTVLGSKLLERLFSAGRDQVAPLANAILTSLNEKHMLLYLTNDPLNSLFKDYHWDGALVHTDGDYLYVVDANLGGTKADYYVEKKRFYTVSSLTRDGILRATLKLEYKHNGKDLAWPGGPYTDYVRVITATGAKLTGATIKVDDKAEEKIMDKIIIGTENGYNSFATNFVLQPQSTLVLTITYDLGPQLSLIKGTNNYSLYWQKQPGTLGDEINFILAKPFGFRIAQTSDNLISKPDTLELHTKHTYDQKLYVKLQ